MPNGNYVDWSSQRVVTVLDAILTNVLSKDSCNGGLDGIVDMLTDDGSVALPLEFEASVPLGGLANLSIALTWFNISGIDSFNGLSILEPLDPYTLATSLDLGYLNMSLGISLKVIPTSETVEDFVLVENFNIYIRLKDVSLAADLFLAMVSNK